MPVTGQIWLKLSSFPLSLKLVSFKTTCDSCVLLMFPIEEQAAVSLDRLVGV